MADNGGAPGGSQRGSKKGSKKGSQKGSKKGSKKGSAKGNKKKGGKKGQRRVIKLALASPFSYRSAVAEPEAAEELRQSLARVFAGEHARARAHRRSRSRVVRNALKVGASDGQSDGGGGDPHAAPPGDGGDGSAKAPTKEARAAHANLLRSTLCVGINRVTRGLERGTVALVAVCTEGVPSMLTSHIPGLCATQGVALAQLPISSTDLGGALGLKSASAIGVWKAAVRVGDGGESGGGDSGGQGGVSPEVAAAAREVYDLLSPLCSAVELPWAEGDTTAFQPLSIKEVASRTS